MDFKKQEWFELKRNGLKFELVVRDQDFKKLETKRFTPHDFDRVMKDIGKRYGISNKMLSPTDEIQEEIEWLKKEAII